MAKNAAADQATETKKIINPRAEIDTSPPFESVKEAVNLFGGSGPWIPHHLLRSAAPDHSGSDVFDVDKMEEQAMQLEKDLILKEQETLKILKELEAAKRLVEGFKVNLMQEMPSYITSQGLSSEFSYDKSPGRLGLCPVRSPGLIVMELNQAKTDLSKMSTDIAVIRTSVETLNKRMRRGKQLLEKSSQEIFPGLAKSMLAFDQNDNEPPKSAILEKNAEVKDGLIQEGSLQFSGELQELNFEAEQFKKMAEASRYEVMKAMSELERTKTSIKLAEMRLNAAKKMEEAAKAVEAIAFAERKALLDSKKDALFADKSQGIMLPFEEYYALATKAQQAEEMWKTKFVDTSTIRRNNESDHDEVAIIKKLEESSKVIKQKKNSLEEAMEKEEGAYRRKFVDEICREIPQQHDQEQCTPEHSATKFKFRNSDSSLRGQRLDGEETNRRKHKTMPFFRSTISIGDVLSRKLILQDDIMVGKHMESHTEGEQVSLSQMLREQSGLILQPAKSMKDGSVQKQFIAQRKKFGFIQVALSKQSKKKPQASDQS